MIPFEDHSPVARPLLVIMSCETLDQLNTAQIYAVRWLKVFGYGKHSNASKFLLRCAHVKMRKLLGAPWHQSLKPGIHYQATQGHSD